jgi:RNA polymerase sigma-70 factor (ECF subfamily)
LRRESRSSHYDVSGRLVPALGVQLCRPTQAAERAERMLRVPEALNSLNPIDRDVLALRHFKQLGRAEAAQVLRISQEAGAKRYFRALKRLKGVLATMPGGGEVF